jgi:hypothetical protein
MVYSLYKYYVGQCPTKYLLSQLLVLSKSIGGKPSAVFLYGLTFVQILMFSELPKQTSDDYQRLIYKVNLYDDNIVFKYLVALIYVFTHIFPF